MRSAGDAGERCELESCLLKHLGWTHLPLGHTRYPSGLSFGPEKQSRFFCAHGNTPFSQILAGLMSQFLTNFLLVDEDVPGANHNSLQNLQFSILMFFAG